MPHNTTLTKYSCADTSSPDGLMMESIAQASQMMDDLKVDNEDFHRKGNLSWDSHTIRDKIGYDHNSKNLSGYAANAFNLDIIVEQFKKMQDSIQDTNDADEEDGDSEPSAKKEKHSKLDEVALGKHYMIFYFHTWTGKCKTVSFMAARFCLASLSARWIVMDTSTT